MYVIVKGKQRIRLGEPREKNSEFNTFPKMRRRRGCWGVAWGCKKTNQNLALNKTQGKSLDTSESTVVLSGSSLTPYAEIESLKKYYRAEKK